MAETIALVGSETLLGKEVSEVLGESALGQSLRLVAGETQETGKLVEISGSPTFLAKLEADAVDDADVLILAGSAESSKNALKGNPSGVVIDLTYAAEDDPEACVRAPQLESDRERGLTGPQIVAHPAAVAIALVLKRLNTAFPIARAIVHVFQPASEWGTKGIEELQQQTVNLLSFQPLPKKIFGAQLSYALLAQLGPDAPVQLQDVEERIERHLASLLERLDGVPMPSLRVIQAPVFHGYSFSFWVDFEESPSVSDLEDALNQEPIEVRAGDFEPPNNVGAAGQSGVSVGAIAPDRNSGSAFWIWAAIDNLRMAADTAAMIARESL